MNNTLISVIIPVYNCERYLAEEVESVLAQTWGRIETVFVDDSSTDGSADVAKRFSPLVRYDLQPHVGPGAARNRGVKLAQGDYLAFLDADDLWAGNKLELQMAAFNSDTLPDAVFGHVEQFISPDLSRAPSLFLALLTLLVKSFAMTCRVDVRQLPSTCNIWAS